MKDGQQKPQDLIVLLKGHKTYIQTHNFPDPDAIASAYGLQYFLQQFGIDAILCYDGSIDKLSTKRMLTVFSMEILHADLLADMQESDYIVTVDGQKYNTNLQICPEMRWHAWIITRRFGTVDIITRISGWQVPAARSWFLIIGKWG